MQWNFEGFEASAAKDLVLAIDALLDEPWQRHDDGPGMWRWQLGADDDPDLGAPFIVAINGRADRVLVPMHGWPEKVGPTVMAGSPGDLFVSVTLPNLTDNRDLEEALGIVASMVPQLNPAPHGCSKPGCMVDHG